MSKALKCDRCGKYYEKNVLVKSVGAVHGGIINGIITSTAEGKEDKHYDLCDDCIKKLFDWMNQANSGSKWIPVSVGYPDSERKVLVNVKEVQNDAFSFHIDIARLIVDGYTQRSVWECKQYGVVGINKVDPHFRVTAWMELPEIYKERALE